MPDEVACSGSLLPGEQPGLDLSAVPDDLFSSLLEGITVTPVALGQPLALDPLDDLDSEPCDLDNILGTAGNTPSSTCSPTTSQVSSWGAQTFTDFAGAADRRLLHYGASVQPHRCCTAHNLVATIWHIKMHAYMRAWGCVISQR